ncbi:MAG TPA: biotin--[acetyl-CoA-carboxylase] ligase [Peptococcaceae bacterium]|nr:biotin--[acetyl-CoA-carboxylase] ligase [Peptococcaceae bacterium]
MKQEVIARLTRTEFIGKKIIIHQNIDSTNCEAKRQASHLEEGTVIISEVQTAGRGRLGREWASPAGKGIWQTIVLKPNLSPPKVPQLTLVAAAAVYLAVEKVDPNLGKILKIKWPNDIYLREKKAGGILTEMQVSADQVRWVVVGIGLNVNLTENDFPEDLRGKATSFLLETGRSYDRNIITAEIFNAFEPLYLEFLETGELGTSLEICRQHSAVIGRKVILSHGGSEKEAQVLDLGPQGELIIRLIEGDITSVVSGEVSLKVSDHTY